MAGPKGRHEHRAFPLATYEYEKNRKEQGSSSLEMTQSVSPPGEEEGR